MRPRFDRPRALPDREQAESLDPRNRHAVPGDRRCQHGDLVTGALGSLDWLLPFLLLAVLGWAIAEGHLLALPCSVAVLSLLVQSHLSYVYLAPLVVIAGIVLHLVAVRGAWRPLLRPVAWSAGSSRSARKSRLWD